MGSTRVSRALVGTDGKLRPIIRALIYSALAFWLLSADEFLGPPLRRAATALLHLPINRIDVLVHRVAALQQQRVTRARYLVVERFVKHGGSEVQAATQNAPGSGAYTRL